MTSYRIKDLNEAAFLYAKGQKLIGLERETNFYWFVFNDEGVCQQLSDSFWQGEAEVNAKKYADSLRTLKDRLFARK